MKKADKLFVLRPGIKDKRDLFCHAPAFFYICNGESSLLSAIYEIKKKRYAFLVSENLRNFQ